MATIKEIVIKTKKAFTDAGIDNPQLDTRLLLEAALGVKFEEILLKYNDDITDSESKTLDGYVAQRLARKPISRILGYNYFWTSKFKISDETLDPRPDTETIIDAVMARHNKQDKLKILDLGTGSGCILISLLQEFPNAEGVGVDISADAISTSQINAENLDVSDRSSFITSSWADLKLDDKFDIIVSNPPYIEDDVIKGLEPEVKEYDPLKALSGGEDGLECYKEISKLLPNLLAKKGEIFFEIGYNQADKVKELLALEGLFVIKVLKDLTNHDRCVVAKWAE